MKKRYDERKKFLRSLKLEDIEGLAGTGAGVQKVPPVTEAEVQKMRK